MPLHRVDAAALSHAVGALATLRDHAAATEEDLFGEAVRLGDRPAEDALLAHLDGAADVLRALGEEAREVGLALRAVAASAADSEAAAAADAAALREAP